MYAKGILSLTDLSHREAIRELLARYCYLHTDHDFAGIAELFTEDGCFESLAGPRRGREEIRDYYLHLLPGAGAAPDRKHFISETRIDLRGEEASVTSQFMLVRHDGTAPQVVAVGRYFDELVLQGGEWRFRHRKVIVDHHGDMGLHGRSSS